jgi:hypothetical protein
MQKLILIYSVILAAVIQTTAQEYYNDKPSDKISYPSGCTVITISKGDSVYFGGNDDYIEPDSYYWVQPGDSSRYGVIWIGTPDNPQQGMNEKYLAYDANGLPRVDVNPHTEKIPVPGQYHNYIMQIMHECSTVKEVISWAQVHQRPPYMHDQLHFADATGDAVIISAGEDGEIVFTRKTPGDGFLVSTNFNVANPSNGFNYPCWRYDRAGELMEQLIDRDEPLDYRDLTNVMDAVHEEEAASWTLETMVADLVNGLVYIYYFYQYDRPVVLNVKNELSNPREPGPLSKLFPQDVQEEASRRYKKASANLRMNRIVGIAWPALLLVSLIIFFTIRAEDKKGRVFWIIAVVILGPFALIVRYLTAGYNSTSNNRIAMIETLGDLIPLVISYTIALIILITGMLSGNLTWQRQIIIILGLPLVFGLMFHVTFLNVAGKSNFGRLLLRRIPQVLITTFLGLGGMVSIALPLVNKSLNMSLLIPLSPFPIMTWWAIVVLGALAGGLLIFIFESWEVKRNYRAWSVLTGGEEELIIPQCKKLWWWILISIVILFAGLIAGVLLAR